MPQEQSRASQRIPGEPTPVFVAGTDAGYVDSAVCHDCHQDIAASYRLTGMSRSFFRPRRENTAEFYGSRNTFYHQTSDRHYQMYVRDGRYYQRRHQIGFDGRETNIVEKEIHYVLGSGNHARTYLNRTDQGELLELPVAWYAENGGQWAMNPGYDRPDHEDFRRRVTYDCMFCHNGYPQITAGSDSGDGNPVFKGSIPEGIDCQRCHGPGRNHVEALKSGRATLEVKRSSIVNPARLSPEKQLELCMQCHLESTSFRLPYSIRRYERGVFSYRPGEPLADYILHFDHAPGTAHDNKFEIVNAAYRLRKSACFQGGRLVCTTCHNPHDIPRGEDAIQHYSGVCRSCHETRLESLMAANRHTGSQDCAGCHMPKRRTEDVVHAVMTDHYIQRHKPARNLVATMQEVTETEDSAYKGEVVLYYPPKLPASAADELYLAVAQVKQHANLKEGIPRFERAIDKYRPELVEFYFELAEAYWKAGHGDGAIGLYEEALRRKPDYLPALRRLGTALHKAGRLSESARVLERALAIAPSDAMVLSDLGLVWIGQERLREAVPILRKALAADPDLPEAHNNLGLALMRAGEEAGAEEAFRGAVAVQPDSAQAHTNLANLLAAAGDFRQAQYHFEKAIQNDPKYVEARYNYGNVLARMGVFDKAQEQFEKAVWVEPNLAVAQNSLGDLFAMKGKLEPAIHCYRRAIQANPEFATAYFNLGTALAAQNKRTEAKQELESALRWNPNYHEAHLNLAKVLAGEGNLREARSHLLKAAESPDPQVRQATLDSLNAIGETGSKP